MAPPKAKGHAGKWICITASVVVLAVASFFLSQSVNEKTDISELTHPSMAATETSPNIGSHRIALLPFEVNAAMEEDKWIGGGMDNELKTALNKIDGVTIIAGLSVNGYRGSNREISKIKSNFIGSTSVIDKHHATNEPAPDPRPGPTGISFSFAHLI